MRGTSSSGTVTTTLHVTVLVGILRTTMGDTVDVIISGRFRQKITLVNLLKIKVPIKVVIATRTNEKYSLAPL